MPRFKTKILQLTGSLVHGEFENLTKAARKTGYYAPSIQEAINTQRQYQGYLWKRVRA